MLIKKLFLTSILAFGTIVPVGLHADMVETGDACDNETLGDTSTAVLVAKWVATEYKCGKGKYFNKTTLTCDTCTANNYCGGGTYTVESENVGLNECPTTYPYSAAGSMNASLCYKTVEATCATANPYNNGHGSGVYANTTATARVYNGNSVQRLENPSDCALTSLACDPGYSQTGTKGVLADYVNQTMFWVEGNNAIQYRAVNNSGNNSDNYDGLGPAAGLSNGQVIATYPDNTKIIASAQCSETSGTNMVGVDTISATWGENCWCKLTGYSIKGGATQNTPSAPYVFISSGACSGFCARRCASYVSENPGWRRVAFAELGEMPKCVPNTINLDWDPKNGGAHTQNTCEYDAKITLPETPSRQGYIFNGWKVKTNN